MYEVIKQSNTAALGDVLRVHDFNYLMRVIELANTEKYAGIDEYWTRYDRDTAISKESWDASLLSCGSVTYGIDMIMNHKAKNIFCAVRPPGHHAGIFGSTL